MGKQKGSARPDWLVWVFVFFVVLMAVGFLDSVSCTAKWGKSGMRVSWGPVQGCLVQTKDGRWVPEGSYREVP